MILRLTHLSLLYAGLALAPAVSVAADRAQDWLMKIGEAAHRLNYDGTFVYLHGQQLESLRIVHRVEDGRERERLVSLNGAPREIVRDDRRVVCYLSQENPIAVEHRKADKMNFPALLPKHLQDLEANYVIQLGRSERVAGRIAQQVIVRPRDDFRYGYHLWADKASGLLLRSDLVDQKGQAIEQFLFTQVTIGGAIPDAALEPEGTGKKLKWKREGPSEASADDRQAAEESRWTVGQLPSGFRFTGRMVRKSSLRNVLAEHQVYSDGLATVSVFIEKSENPSAVMKGVTSMGAVHALGTQVADHQVTVVGEVPAATIIQIANSITPQR
jgi:sigma-E factor negative regulatory protein RseB